MDHDSLARLLAEHEEHGDLLALLKEAQARHGGLTPDLLTALARALDVPVNELYGIASFYSFLSTAPVGRHTIRICQCVPCRMSGGDAVRVALERELGVKPGETTGDGRFSLRLTNCVGACGQAPSIMIDDRHLSDLNETKVGATLAEFV